MMVDETGEICSSAAPSAPTAIVSHECGAFVSLVMCEGSSTMLFAGDGGDAALAATDAPREGMMRMLLATGVGGVPVTW